EARPVIGRTVLGRIVGGGVWAGPIADPFDKSRTKIIARTLNGPARYGNHCEQVVAICTQRHYAAAHATRGKSVLFASSQCLECGNGPLVVDHVHDHRRPVYLREGKARLEIGFGGGPITYPRGGDPGIAFD